MAWNLRRLRVAQDIAADDFALQAGVDRAYFGKIERQVANPTIDILERLADALGVPVSEFFVVPPKGAQKPKPLQAGRKFKKPTKRAPK